jgi:hypothetical protein
MNDDLHEIEWQTPLRELQVMSGTRFDAPTTKIHQSTQDAHRERSYPGFLIQSVWYARALERFNESHSSGCSVQRRWRRCGLVSRITRARPLFE